MSGGHWERYSAVLVESNRQLREHLDEALRRLRLNADEVELRRLRLNADELELAREHNKTLLALLDRARRDAAVSNRAAELLTQRLIATRRELEDVRASLG